MGQNIAISIIGLLVLLITFSFGFFLQESTRKGVFFGVSIPLGYENKPELQKLLRLYKRNFSISFIIYSIIYLTLLYFFPSPATFIPGIFGTVIVLNINYLYIYSKSKAIKRKENWSIPAKDIVIVDTSFRTNKQKKMQSSALWHLIPAALILLNIILAFYKYDALPAKIPTHWGIDGKVDGWSTKSMLSILSLPMVQIFMAALMFGVYVLIGRVKQQLNPENIEVSREQNRRFRYMWSVFITLFSILINGIFTVIHLNVLQITKSSPFLIILIVILMFALSIAAVVLSLVVGQSGSRLKIVDTKDGQSSVIHRDDDKYWKLGDFYYNPNDPSLFVEKRVSVGWDLNYAHPAAKFIIGGIVLLIIGVIALSIYASTHAPK